MSIADIVAAGCCWPLDDKYCGLPTLENRSFCARHMNEVVAMTPDDLPAYRERFDRLLALAETPAQGSA